MTRETEVRKVMEQKNLTPEDAVNRQIQRKSDWGPAKGKGKAIPLQAWTGP
jgi:hypothetical protein